MIISRKYVDLSENVFAYLYRVSDEEIKKTFEEELNKYIKIIDSIINCDVNKLDPNTYYDLINEMYSIMFTDKEYLELLSKINHQKFSEFKRIEANMTYNGFAQEGHGRDFSYWEETYRVCYIIAVKDGTVIDEKIYSYEELNNMINNMEIVIIKGYTKPVGKKNDDDISYKPLPILDLGIDNYSEYDMSGGVYKDKYFDERVSIIKKRISKKKLLKDIKQCILELQRDIWDVTHRQEKTTNGWELSNYSRLINEYYENSENKELLDNIYTKLK